MCILGFDPGKDQGGIAVRSSTGKIYTHEVIASSQALERLASLCQPDPLDLWVMGNQTPSKRWCHKIAARVTIPITLVDERNSTLEARDRYWQMFPPKGLQKLIPEGMRLPDRPIDDIVAILLIERHLQSK
ncbi:MAG: Holliday junction resolvase RuvX [Microcystis sp.]|uniref:Holliday junction resolvase RuvX n=1 Tax=Microcystis sp. TaxID=1127 RepID=UPI00391F8065